MVKKGERVVERLKLYIDSNIWIYHIEGNKELQDYANTLFKWVISTNQILIGSTLLYTECLVIPKIKQREELINGYFEFFKAMPDLKFIDVNSNIA